MRGSILYYCAPVGGVITYLALLQLFGAELAVPLAWANSLTAIASLCTTAILYLHPETRAKILSRWGSVIPVLIIIGSILYAELTKTENYISPTLTIAILCRLSFLAIQRNDEMRTLGVSILTAVLTPLSSTPVLASESLSRFLLALAIPTTLMAVWYRFFRTEINHNQPIAETRRTSLLPLARSLMAQLPLILFPIMDARVMSIAALESAAEYMMQWKVAYGITVVLYTKIQFKLAFNKMNERRLQSHGRIALIILLMVILATTIDVIWAQIFRLILTAVFVNEVALVTRGRLRCHESFETALIATAFFALFVCIIHFNMLMQFTTDTSKGILTYYPLIICLSISGCLLSVSKPKVSKGKPV